MKRLFDDNSKYTHDAEDFDAEVTAALVPIIKKWMGNGFCPRDISYIIGSVKDINISIGVLRADLESYKAK